MSFLVADYGIVGFDDDPLARDLLHAPSLLAPRVELGLIEGRGETADLQFNVLDIRVVADSESLCRCLAAWSLLARKW